MFKENKSDFEKEALFELPFEYKIVNKEEEADVVEKKNYFNRRNSF